MHLTIWFHVLIINIFKEYFSFQKLEKGGVIAN